MPYMTEEFAERQMLVNYLLGKLPEPERLQVAERYFTDEAFFDQLLAVEDDLLEQFARGQLAADERRDFAAYLQKLPDGRHRLAVTRALVQAAPLSAQPAAEPARWRVWFATPPQLALQFSLIAGLVVAGGGLAWLLLNSQQLRRENQQLRHELSQLNAGQTSLQRQLAEQRSGAEQLRDELARAQQSTDQQAQELARLQALPASLVALTFTAAAREAAQPDTITIRPHTKAIALNVPVASGEKFSRWQARLQTTDGRSVLLQEQRSFRAARALPKLAFRLAASRLTAGSYKLTVALLAQDGVELANDYYFNVVKP